MTATPKKSVRVFHMDVLQNHSSTLFENLIHSHNVTSNTLKEVEFEGYELLRGRFAVKDRQKYWIPENILDELPITVKAYEELKHKEDIVFNPTDIGKFRIKPEHTIPMRRLITEFVDFQHDNPDHWTLMKFVALAGYIGKTFVCVASEPSFGKTSIFNVIDMITDKCVVFKPRTVPGVLNKINSTGNMVFDEAHEAQKDTRDIMEEFTLNIGGGSTTYRNGAMKTHLTQSKYDCSLQSITFLFNNVDCYKDPEKKYFERIFSNNKAMDNRLLKLRLNGTLTQKFHRDFDIPTAAADNKMYYIQLAKEFVYLQEYKKSSDYDREYRTNSILNLKGRRRIVYDEITWIIDQYCKDQKEYNYWIKVLDESIINYKLMVECLNNNEDTRVKDVEVIEE